jgi:hypothetical protein
MYYASSLGILSSDFRKPDLSALLLIPGVPKLPTPSGRKAALIPRWLTESARLFQNSELLEPGDLRNSERPTDSLGLSGPFL